MSSSLLPLRIPAFDGTNAVTASLPFMKTSKLMDGEGEYEVGQSRQIWAGGETDARTTANA